MARKPVGASTVYDAIIIGLGGMGSAAAAELAARGRRVLGIERFSPAHDRGSSHGGSRIIRQAYFEDPAYVPLLLRAYERWRELEAAAGVSLLTETGGLMIGPPTSRTVAGSVASARQWELDHELLSADEVARRWPTLMPARDDVALYEPRAGFVRPEATVAAQVELARGFGAQLRFGEPVLGWEVSDGGVEVTTDRDRYRAARLVLAPGAWAPQVMARFGLPLTVERHVQFWLRSRMPIERFAPARHPIYIWEDHAGTQVYGFPALGGAAEGVKAAFFRRGVSTTADELQRGVAPEEAVPLLDFLSTRLRALGPGVCAAVACLYTTAPDEHFVLGSVGGYERVVICSPCSGHGFKFVPVIGEMVADLVEFGGTRFDISRFDPARFAPASEIIDQR